MSKILVIKNEIRSQTKVKGSKFIASASPVNGKEEAEAFLSKIQHEFYNATHNVYAWRLEHDEPQDYFNDAGEPSGSSGPPILGAIKSFALTNIIIVVTRYFGGTKLGIGGLVRAYGEAAQQVLQIASIGEMVLLQEISFDIPYDSIGNISNLLASLNLKLTNIEYDNESVKIILLMEKGTIPKHLKIFTDAVKGNIANISYGHEKYHYSSET